MPVAMLPARDENPADSPETSQDFVRLFGVNADFLSKFELICHAGRCDRRMPEMLPIQTAAEGPAPFSTIRAHLPVSSIDDPCFVLRRATSNAERCRVFMSVSESAELVRTGKIVLG